MQTHPSTTMWTRRIGHRMLAVALVVALLPGCMTITHRGMHPDTYPRVYAATLIDLTAIASPIVGPATGNWAVLGWSWILVPVGLLDLPFSLVAETVMLPITIPEQTALNRKRGFITAGATGDMARVGELLAEHPKLDRETYFDEPFLSVAAATGQPEFVTFLIERGADVNAANKNGQTALHYTIAPSPHLGWLFELEELRKPERQAGYVEVVRLLIKHGANVNDPRYVVSPLGQAALQGRVDLVRVMVESGADVNVRNKRKQSLLHFAVYGGHLEVARFLIEHGVDVNVRDNRGETPLGAALRHEPRLKKPQMAKLLRAHGAKQ